MISHTMANFTFLNYMVTLLIYFWTNVDVDIHFIISRRALAREGDYEMMPVCVCVRVCVR